MLRRSRHFLSTLVLLSAFGTAHAAELGEARVSSHIGQPLVADIELTMLDDPAQAVAVRVANPEVYRGAGIAVPPVLANLNLSVMRRDGRQFLHVTSLRPLDSEHLHLYLELTDKGQRTVRLATLWLTPDPNPAPLAAPVPAVVARAEPARVVSPGVAAVVAPVVVPSVAPAVKPAVPPAPVRKSAAMRKSEQAIAGPADEEGGKQALPVKAHTQAKPADEPVHATPKAMAPKAAAPLPLPIRASHTAAPAACAQQAQRAEQAGVCAALDGKTAELNAKIGALEGKVKSLQAKLGAAPAAVSPAPAPPPAPAPEIAHEPPGPKPISAIKPLVPRKHKAPPPAPESSLPWGWIGAGAALLLALAGATMLLRRRARTVRNVDIPAAPRLIDRVRDSLASRSKTAPAPAARAAAAPPAEAVEPTFE